jgi:hypothetical protein
LDLIKKHELPENLESSIKEYKDFAKHQQKGYKIPILARLGGINYDRLQPLSILRQIYNSNPELKLK